MQTPAELEEAVALVGSWAMKQSLIEKVYFFGSRVRGNHRATSDLDIAVMLRIVNPNSALAHWYSYVELWAHDLTKKLPWRAHLEWYHVSATPQIASGISYSSILVYSRASE